MELISILCLIAAACCNAVMDTLADKAHFDKSIFSKLNPEFWLKTESWDNKYKDIDNDGEGDVEAGLRFKGPLGWINNIFDAWHIFQSAMVVLIICSIVFYPYAYGVCIFKATWINIIISIFLYGLAWNISFMLLYSRLLVRKK